MFEKWLIYFRDKEVSNLLRKLDKDIQSIKQKYNEERKKERHSIERSKPPSAQTRTINQNEVDEVRQATETLTKINNVARSMVNEHDLNTPDILAQSMNGSILQMSNFDLSSTAGKYILNHLIWKNNVTF